MLLGKLVSIWRYPVKALKAEPLEQADVTASGLAGDRGSALFVASADHARSGKTYRGKEHELLHLQTRPQDALALGTARGLALESRNAGPYFDDSPVSIIFDTWLAQAEALTELSLDPLRYRPNLFVQAADGTNLREADLVGATLTIGTTRLLVSAEIKRCVTTTYDVQTGAAEPSILRELALHRANVMGIYCVVEQTGIVSCGDPVNASGEAPSVS